MLKNRSHLRHAAQLRLPRDCRGCRSLARAAGCRRCLKNPLDNPRAQPSRPHSPPARTWQPHARLARPQACHRARPNRAGHGARPGADCPSSAARITPREPRRPSPPRIPDHLPARAMSAAAPAGPRPAPVRFEVAPAPGALFQECSPCVSLEDPDADIARMKGASEVVIDRPSIKARHRASPRPPPRATARRRC